MRIKAWGGRGGGVGWGKMGRGGRGGFRETKEEAVATLIASAQLCVWFPVLSQCVNLGLNAVTLTPSLAMSLHFGSLRSERCQRSIRQLRLTENIWLNVCHELGPECLQT